MSNTEPYKLIVAGGRGYRDYDKIKELLSQRLENGDRFSVVSGMDKGAAIMGRQAALDLGFEVHEFSADREKYRREAGFLRNAEMGLFGDRLLAFWDGKSRGTEHIINIMEGIGKPVEIVRYG